MSKSEPGEPRPSMGPTTPASLVVAALASAAVAWLVINRFYADMPTLPWLPPVTLAALAVAEGLAAHNTKARIERQPGREPVDPLLVARFAVLAKASSLAGAIFGGLYGGLSVWLLIERARNAHAASDLPKALAGVMASALLIAGALWLERSCRVPEQPDESGKKPSDQVS